MSEGVKNCPNPNGCFCDGTCKKKPSKFNSLEIVKKISEKDKKTLSEASKIYKERRNTTLIEKLEGMCKSYSMRNISQEYNEGYNQALQDAIDLIKGEE